MAFRQDMPPPGGYAPIVYKRIPHKKILNGWAMLGITLGMAVWSWPQYWRWKYFTTRLQVEKYDTLIALEPFIQAERDRAFLKHLSHLREEERELMKNHPVWEVGTLYGDRIFKQFPKDTLVQFDINEYYAHRPAHECFHDWCWPDFNM